MHVGENDFGSQGHLAEAEGEAVMLPARQLQQEGFISSGSPARGMTPPNTWAQPSHAPLASASTSASQQVPGARFQTPRENMGGNSHRALQEARPGKIPAQRRGQQGQGMRVRAGHELGPLRVEAKLQDSEALGQEAATARTQPARHAHRRETPCLSNKTLARPVKV